MSADRVRAQALMLPILLFPVLLRVIGWVTDITVVLPVRDVW